MSMSTNFGAKSKSRFPFRAHTNRQTNGQMRLNALPHAGGYTSGVGTNKAELHKLYILANFSRYPCFTRSPDI